MERPLVDRLVPAELLASDPATRRQARLSVWLAVGVAPVFLFLTSGSLALRGPNVLAAELLAGAVLLLAAVPVLRVSHSVPLTATVVIAGTFGPVVAVCWSGYGLLSPGTSGLVLAPVVGFVLGGARIGVPMAFLSIAVIEALHFAPMLGREPPLQPSGDVYRLLVGQVQVVVVAMVANFLYFYDGAWRRAIARSDADREALARARDIAVQADAVKGRFLASMSHELRTPLNAILGYTELLLEEQGNPDLERIHRSGHHLLALVDDVLDLARIEEGRVSLRLGPVELDEVVAEAVESVRPMVPEAVELDAEVGAHTVWADPARLRQVLTNLLSNACKFTEAGHVRVRARRDGHGIEVTVADTGRGMTAAEVARCFEPFEQADPAGGEGTGLGLAITRRLARLMGGEVTVQSDAGRGSTFTVQLRVGSAETPRSLGRTHPD